MTRFPRKLTDARGRTIHLTTPPQRIVSLVPSITELLAALGLDHAVVGLTRFCVRPPDWKRRKTIVGGTKQINLERLLSLQPDLVLANLEENTRAIVEMLDPHVPVFVTYVRTLDEALHMIRQVGSLTDTEATAETLAATIAQRFATLPAYPSLRTLYLIWRDPWMSIGGDTFIHDMLRRGGFANVCAHQTRYPTLTPEAIRTLHPEVVLLSSEPYPFREAHLEELRPLCPHATFLLVDGQPFSWYGARLLETPAYLQQLRRQLLSLLPS
ncbi:helical backbone metal receptor [Rhodothermus profundi]|uniref:ABC-type Fe3+-hydroxamate transport system, substrate-binding protein n=1 Tax=Rhodothermus profundi TaxID=633813 RepID=A0A1M6VFP1_9BACT|nr:helical backbone metal receptor [Rhodothermus profundi]SHK80096.1 ABC-type Fe3+-hydroxamate transport system, substrate-binding protein [Rhodothermus profundi]